MNILLTIHHELDPNAGVPGVTYRLGHEYQVLGHNVNYYSFSDLPSRFPGILKSTILPEFVANHIATLNRSKHAIRHLGVDPDREEIVANGIPAMNQILQQQPQVMMSFLGTGCSEERVHADFDPTVRDRLKVIPRYDHELLPSLLQGHHIKLFPTLSEGFSLALPEAMACGLAPVTTATPGSMEIVRDDIETSLLPHETQRQLSSHWSDRRSSLPGKTSSPSL